MNIKKIVKECLNEQIFLEGYTEIDELNRLTTEIIIAFAEKNYPMINRLNRLGFDNTMRHYFNEDSLSLDETINNKSDYKIIGDYINSGVIVMFVDDISASGLYVNNLIKIKYNNDFRDILKYNINLINADEEDNSINKEEAIRILKTSIGVAFRSVLLHELQHSYDDYRSNKKFDKNKLSSNYRNKYKDYDPNKPDSIMSNEQFREYLNLPHEYWSRFTETVIDIYNFKKPYKDIVADFKKKMSGFDSLSNNDKRRLLKSLYKYWEIKQKEYNEED